jgi:excisionase family DNA binding protein
MPVTLNGKRYLTNTEVAHLVSVARQTLWRWRSAGRIPLGRQYRGRTVLFSEPEVKEIQRYSERVEPVLAGRATPPHSVSRTKGL